MKVRPKKFLGQHFLRDKHIAGRIVDCLTFQGYQNLIEIGPGMGILTDLLFERYPRQTMVIEIDPESVSYLSDKYPDKKGQIIEADFLTIDLDKYISVNAGIIGNLPYNIASQIFFRIFEYRDYIQEVVGMVQKEVAERLAADSGNKKYGILSVMLSAFYDIEKLFTVKPGSFYPSPKVMSAVIRLRRNKVKKLDCVERNFVKVVKQGFQNRRKTLRNALKPLNLPDYINKMDILNCRAEQLTVEEFVFLTQKIELFWING